MLEPDSNPCVSSNRILVIFTIYLFHHPSISQDAYRKLINTFVFLLRKIFCFLLSKRSVLGNVDNFLCHVFLLRVFQKNL